MDMFLYDNSIYHDRVKYNIRYILIKFVQYFIMVHI